MSLLTMVPTLAQPLTTTKFFPPRRTRVPLKSAQAQSLEGLTAGPPPVATTLLSQPQRGNFNPTAFVTPVSTFQRSNKSPNDAAVNAERLENVIASSEWQNYSPGQGSMSPGQAAMSPGMSPMNLSSPNPMTPIVNSRLPMTPELAATRERQEEESKTEQPGRRVQPDRAAKRNRFRRYGGDGGSNRTRRGLF